MHIAYFFSFVTFTSKKISYFRLKIRVIGKTRLNNQVDRELLQLLLTHRNDPIQLLDEMATTFSHRAENNRN